MNIMVFDTETTSINKPFCYNIGYKIVNAESRETLVRRDYVVEQVWQNLELFTTAYYENKRQLYVSRMRARKVVQEKFGYICRQMYRDIKSFDIEHGYAYNSTFDIGVFEYVSFCEQPARPPPAQAQAQAQAHAHPPPLPWLLPPWEALCFIAASSYLGFGLP